MLTIFMVDNDMVAMSYDVMSCYLYRMHCSIGQSPLVWGTNQCYLKGAEQNLTKQLTVADSVGVCYGVKVRLPKYRQFGSLLRSQGLSNDARHTSGDRTEDSKSARWPRLHADSFPVPFRLFPIR